MGSKTIRPLLVTGFLLPLVAGGGIGAVQFEGTANGNLALISNGEEAFGYSTYTMLWSSMELEGECLAVEASPSLGFVLTTSNLFAYNAVNGGWFRGTYGSPPLGYDVNQATILFWNADAVYGISTVWAQWARKNLKPQETPLGGASGGSFGLVWTNQEAHAYTGTTGQWSSKQLGGPPLGGIARDGLGLVWTDLEAYAYEPSPGTWYPLDLMGYPAGMSASGAGDVALIWSANTALAYSSQARDWFTLDCPIDDGCAAGSVALVWNEEVAYGFDGNRGTWSSVLIRVQGSSGGPEPLPDAATFSVGPNPCRGEPLRLRLPDGDPWKVSIVDLEGRTLHSMEVPAGPGMQTVAWDWQDDQGRPVPAGTYWVRAASESQREARRIIHLP